uniref:Uricase n=1 Tax=Timema tahoe TaxID=61484 RepID=A0A7R9P085_9NEOP|nr:unnamed protein product [Timema tahoe]
MTWGNTDKSYEDNVGCHDCGGVTSDVGPGFDSRTCHDTYRLPCGRGLQAGRVLVKGMYAKRRPAGGAAQQSQGVQTLRPNTVRGTTPKVKSSLVASMLTPKLVSGTSTTGYSPTKEEPDSDYTKSESNEEYQLTNHGYGKNSVKLLHVHREGSRHTIREYEVDTRLRLHSNKDYLTGDNRDIIATDTQKNTVYLLAKKYGVESPEDFALLLCNHFLYTYRHVDEVSVHVQEYPWERLQVDSVDHNHAFIFSPKALRFCTVTQARNAEGTEVLSPKCFSTILLHIYDYTPSYSLLIPTSLLDIVKECILDKFAGPPEKGVFSPSVQNTLYLTEKMALDKVPQIRRIEMHMPNKHYFTLDLSKFPSLVKGENKEVYQPVDKPSGIIHAVLERKSRSKL